MLGSHNKPQRRIPPIPCIHAPPLSNVVQTAHTAGSRAAGCPRICDSDQCISHYFDYKSITAICTSSPVKVPTLTRTLLLYLRGEQKCQSINLPIEQLHATDETPFRRVKEFCNLNPTSSSAHTKKEEWNLIEILFPVILGATFVLLSYVSNSSSSSLASNE